MTKEGKKKIETEENVYEENIYSNFEEKKENPFDNNDFVKSNAGNNVSVYQYKEKEYKHNTLEENTKITKSSLASRVLLFGFYILVVIIGVLAVFMIRANKYEFYIKKDEVLIGVGSSYQVELIPKDIRYFDYLKYNYSIGDESIATVDEYGTVTTKNAGRTTLKISLKPGGFTSKTIQIVSEEISIDDFDIAVYKNDKFKVADSVDLKTNQSTTIKAVIKNNDDINATAVFRSSNEDVAIVDSFGNVTGKDEGQAIITGELGGVEESIVVKVKKESTPVVTPKPTSTTTTKPTSTTTTKPTSTTTTKPTSTTTTKPTSTTTTKPTSTTTTKPTSTTTTKPTSTTTTKPTSTTTTKPTSTTTTKPTSTTTTKPTSTTTTKPTSTTTTKPTSTTTTKPTSTTTKPITIKVTKISLGIASQTTKYVGEELRLSPTVEPSSAKNYTVKWSSSNSSVATVSNGVIKCKSAGTAVITAEVDGVKASSTIIVKNKETAPQGTQFSVSELKLSGTSLTINKGKTATFTVTVTKAAGTVKITSSNTNVAKVALPVGDVDMPTCNQSKNTCFFDGLQSGNTLTFTVTGVANGTAYINVETDDLQTINLTAVKGTGKVGILVK